MPLNTTQIKEAARAEFASGSTDMFDAHPELHDDIDFLRDAALCKIAQGNFALLWSNPILQADKETVKTALAKRITLSKDEQLDFIMKLEIAPALTDDEGAMSELIATSFDVLPFASPRLLDNLDFIRNALRLAPDQRDQRYVASVMSHHLRNTPAVIHALMTEYPQLYLGLDKRKDPLATDLETFLSAMAHGAQIFYPPHDIPSDEWAKLLHIFEQEKGVDTPLLPEAPLTEIEQEYLLEIKEGRFYALRDTPDMIRNNPTIARAAFDKDPGAMAFFGDKLLKNMSFMRECISKDPDIINYVGFLECYVDPHIFLMCASQGKTGWAENMPTENWKMLLDLYQKHKTTALIPADSPAAAPDLASWVARTKEREARSLV